MKEALIKVLISCEMQATGTLVNKHFAPSSSIEDIADYLAKYIEKVTS